MGLRKGEEIRLSALPVRAWLVPGVVVLVALALMLGGDFGREWLRFERGGIAAGEVWRLLTGHFVHLGVSHTLLNLAGLVLVWVLVGRAYTWRQWLLVTGGSVAAIDLGLWLGSPQLEWYVGLSGLLHGMLAAGIVAGLADRNTEALILAVVVTGKLAWEQFVGPLPGSEATSGGAVIVDAHLYGVIGAVVAAAALVRVRRRASI
ncbi:MAG: rhombosortase [Gammaproteobacteria bacterium]|jgi:rhomboid family GlyGly-CTERM serine protease|nr:rhombosortase [Gammaproteobacteria bacterium]MDH3905754.1 rhombosortase [Gammaproteobacteria bacterium]MDH3908941.1 rhombosortase [Gammaproteobacteria bacterium]MDH4006041.1 rhombosortase [Gammaproteobacteria bacterium]NCF60034.1 rhombosortase [Gammaproteobacteria bacterium]